MSYQRNTKTYFLQGLINGEWKTYNLCSKERDSYSNIENKKYLGIATQLKVNDIEQSRTDHNYHCWIRYN